MRIQVFFVLLLVAVSASLIAQNSYRMSEAFEEGLGAVHTHSFEDGRYWVFEALPSGNPITGNDILRITEFDECGPLRSSQFTLEGCYGIIYFNTSFVEGDTLRLGMLFNARSPDHPHAEIGFLSIDMETFGHRYNYLRADNYLHLLSFFPTQDGKYFVHTFLSYTDRPIQYCSFLLNENFEVERYFENFTWGTITGFALEIEGGYFVTTAKYIYKLDFDLNMVWIKYLPEKMYTRQPFLMDDGVVFRVILLSYEPGLVYEYGLVKTDFEGNLIWASEDFNFGEEKYGVIQMIQNADNNFELAVSKQYNDFSDYNKDLAVFTIDGTTGNTLKREHSFNTTLVDSFRLKKYFALADGGRQLIIEDQDLNTVVWNISEFSDCNLEEGAPSFQLSPVIIEETSFMPSIEDTVYTGTYAWEQMASEIEAALICEAELAFDFLPDEIEICEETGWTMDLSSINYDIVWEDDSADKIRFIDEAGSYSYTLEYCGNSYAEIVEVSTKSCDCNFDIPTVFSPNGDGLNDVFRVLNNCDELVRFELRIFNRWGAEVYFSEDQYEHWDGTAQGKKLNSDVFVFQLRYQSVFSDKMKMEAGNITLLQ